MQIEVGKTYLTRNNNKVTILSKSEEPSSYPYIGSDGRGYASDGSFSKIVSSPYDLICEAKEPKKESKKEDDYDTWRNSLTLNEVEEYLKVIYSMRSIFFK